MSGKKTIAVIGATGIQGGSVASVFANLPEWQVRGITRNTSKPSPKGVELVTGNIDDIESLKQAFKGANVIFGTTDFWQHIKDAQTEAEGRNITVNEVAYEREVQQGKNIVDAAAATVDSLDHFILSTLSDSKKWSKGKITFNLHFDAKWKAVEYCKATYPELWKKTSMVQLAHYATNWMSFGMGLPKKNDEGKFVLSMPMSGDAKVPIVDAGADTGHSVKALLSLPPNTNLMCCGSLITWTEYANIWGRINNVDVSFSSYPGSVMEQQMGTVGREFADMFAYVDEFGYDGGDPSVLYPWVAKEKYGVDVKYTTIEEYLKKQDWKPYL